MPGNTLNNGKLQNMLEEVDGRPSGSNIASGELRTLVFRVVYSLLLLTRVGSVYHNESDAAAKIQRNNFIWDMAQHLLCWALR